MASQILSRLGIVLAVDSGELVHGLTEAQKNFDQLSREGKRATEALGKEMIQLKYATEDYGKTLTKVQLLEREINSGRFKGADQNLIKGAMELAKAYDARAASAKKLTNVLSDQQKLQVSYQMTDFFTQIASGQNAMIAFIQQGGQLKDSMGGIGNAIKAVASVFTPFRLAMIGGVSSIAAVGYAAYSGAKELDEFNKAMNTTGGYAGIAYGELLMLGNTLQTKTNVAIGDARDVMMSLVESGKFTKTSIESVGAAILKFSKAAGVDGKEAAAKLIPMLDGTAASAKQLNDKYHILTLAQYQQIEALEKQGKTQEAILLQANLLQDQFDKAERKLGTLQRAWRDVGKWASWAWDQMLNIGREEDTVVQLEKINVEIVKTMKTIAEKRAMGLNAQLMEAELEKLKARFQTTLDKLVKESEDAAAKSESAEKNGRSISLFAKAGGSEAGIRAAREAQKEELDAFFKNSQALASEEKRIEIKLQKEITEAVLEEYYKNQDTFGFFAAEAARKRVAKVAAAEAQAERERFEYRKKQAWDAASKQFDQETDIVHRLMDEKKKIFDDAENRRDAQLFAREELDAKFSLIGATQKELDIMKAKIDAQKELQQLMRSQQFMNMSPEDQEKAKQVYDQTLQAKIANIELAESLQRVQGMYDAVWSNMSSAIENFVRTGKLSIKDLTKSIIQDMLIMNMKLQAMALVRSMFNMFSPSFSPVVSGDSALSASSAAIMGRKAAGGPVAGGSTYLVGEQGPELFTPSGSGTIIPNHQLAGGGVTNVTNNYINAIDAKSFEQRLLESNQTIWSANQYANKNMATNFGRT